MPALLLCLIVTIWWLEGGLAIAAAPITPSGLNTQVGPPVTLPNGQTQYNITGGTRPGGGANLFHSFGDFNVPNNNIANFLNNSGLPTSNILGRVTGGNISNIFGTIQTTGFGNANLFLMNPAGFLFGPNATINVGGMVSFTSADYLRLSDGARFNAIPNANADALLSASPVAAFGFLGSNPGAITVQGSQLTVTPGQSLSLVGGNITIQSGTLGNGTVQPAVLTAQGGQINLASVASPGEVLAGSLAYAPNVNGQSFGALGTINISEQSHIDASGNGGGTVVIRGGQFVLDNSTISANVTGPGPVVNGTEAIGGGIDVQVSQNAVIQNGSVLETNILGNATPGVQYGGVHVKADQIQIIGSTDMDNLPFTGVRSDISPGSTGGNSGNILLEANTILVQDLGTFTTTVETATGGAGHAGNIVINATGNLVLDGPNVQSMSQSSPGNTGDITITSAQGNISGPNVPLIQTVTDSGSGNAGNIIITAQGNISMDGPVITAVSQFGTGNAGNISLTSHAGNISMTGGPLVQSQTFNSTGIAGNITLTAPAGDILIAGGAFSGGLGTALRPPPGQNPQAPGSGAIDITARNLTVHDTAVSSDNLSPLQSGNITINLSGTLNLNGTFTDANGAVIHSLIQTTSRGLARSADINITAHDIQVSDGAAISTEAFKAGNAGNLAIHTQTVEVTSGGQIRSGTTLIPGLPPPGGTGGTITVQGPGGQATSVLIDGSGSGFFTNTQGTGAGGSILLNAGSVTVQNSGILSAATSGTASSAVGGSITVNATNGIAINSGGSITASSTGLGNAGNISINAGPQLVLQNGSINTEAAQAGGGNIQIRAGNLVQLNNSSINTSVLGGGGSGGNISIDPNTVLLQNSQILAQAVQGSGGNISITTNLLLPDSNSTISASSQFGQNGTVVVQSPIAPASGKIIPLSQHPLIPVSLMTQRCAALAGGQFSSFTVAGRSTVPAEPAGWLSAPLALVAMDEGKGLETRGDGRWGRGDGEGEPSLLSLRQIAPPGFLTQSFAEDSSTGCASTEIGKG
ncbi:MAG TPA: filamentous hemagglutinin N-terminal domain-containing protein [Nitrospira sp.]|nr:filamentous hemagglutinin N-terminal domain-containing protein [Nitrospira sp.]